MHQPTSVLYSTYCQVNLADQYFSYTVDVSNVGCKCNAAMYFINMPGYENGSPYPADWGVYYCDANNVNGNKCPEYDTFEGCLLYTSPSPRD